MKRFHNNPGGYFFDEGTIFSFSLIVDVAFDGASVSMSNPAPKLSFSRLAGRPHLLSNQRNPSPNHVHQQLLINIPIQRYLDGLFVQS